MKLWAKIGNKRICEIHEVAPTDIVVKNNTHMHQGGTSIGIPVYYATMPDGIRLYVPSPSRYVQIEEEE